METKTKNVEKYYCAICKKTLYSLKEAQRHFRIKHKELVSYEK